MGFRKVLKIVGEAIDWRVKLVVLLFLVVAGIIWMLGGIDDESLMKVFLLASGIMALNQAGKEAGDSNEQ